MIDILGNTIEVGDIVAHGQRSGNSGSIGIKVVLDTLEEDDRRGRKVLKVKVAGCELIERTWVDGNLVDVKPFYRMNRAGWTTPEVLVVLGKSIPEELKEFIEENV